MGEQQLQVAADAEVERLPGIWQPTYWRPTPEDERNGGLGLDELGGLLASAHQSLKRAEVGISTRWWWIADLLNYGLHRHGQAFYQLVQESDYVEDSFNDAARIGAAFDPSRRWDPHLVSFWAHGEVRVLKPAKQDELLGRYASRLKPQPQPLQEEEDIVATPAEEVVLPIRNRPDLRKEVSALRQYQPQHEADDAPPQVGYCPLCGNGRLAVDEIEKYYERERGRA